MALGCWTGVQSFPPARLFSSWVPRDHRYEMVDARAGGRSKMGRENPLLLS